MKSFSLALVGLRGAPQRPLLYIMPLLLSVAAASILAMFLSLAVGIDQAFQTSAAPDEVIVMSKGATYEPQSALSRAAVKTIKNAPMLARLPGRQIPMGSAEAVYRHQFARAGGKGDFAVVVRGTDSLTAARRFRPGFTLVAGRFFKSGRNELIIGSAVRKMNPALRPGETVQIESETWRIVGVFHSTRAADNLEAWGNATDVHQTFTHGDLYESVRVQLKSPGDLVTFRAYLDNHPQLHVYAQRLSAHQAFAASTMRDLIMLIGVIVEVLLFIAACLGAFYALRALIEARTREIGLFRALGFKRSIVFGGLLIEAIIIVLLGSLFAIALVAATFTGQEFYSYNIGGAGTFLLHPQLTPAIVGAAALAALVLGLIGGIGPAWRAGQMSVANVLRE